MPSRVETASIYDEEFSIFRPKMGGGRQPRTKNGVNSFRNAIVARGGSVMRRGMRGVREGAHTPKVPTYMRRVIVKVNIVRMTPERAKAAAAHIRYILRDGVEKDGSPGVLYGPDGPVSPASYAKPDPKEKHQFRITVSPEDGGDLDLTDYVKRYMKRLERENGLKFDWRAVNHYNTEHPHAHIVVRGLDLDHRRVRFSRKYTSHGLREAAQELATELLGPRPLERVRRDRANEVSQQRLTSLDRDIEKMAENSVVRASSRKTIKDAALIVGRLRQLEVLGLASRVSPTSWKLEDRWQKSLRDLGERDDILKQMYKAVSGRVAQYHIVRPGAPLEADAKGRTPIIVGRVVSKGLADELKGTMYAVIETPRGKGYHVQLDAIAADKFRIGDLVSFGMRSGSSERVWVRKTALSIEEQITHRGPTWLDKLSLKTLSPIGFGPELTKALGRRDEFLKGLGITPGSPNLFEALRSLARSKKERGGLER